MSDIPRIFVFCNSCRAGLHSMVALAEDGKVLAGHACSDHGWAAHDMGIHEDGWKRDAYAAHYPNGFTVEWAENPLQHEGTLAAIERHKTQEAPDAQA